jgi:beta-lactamase regulating signal transducer with metallopeptidase domain
MQTVRAAAAWDVVPLGLFPFLAEVTVKAAVVVLAALLATWLLRGRSAALRHTVWASTVLLLVLLPGVVLLAPDWRVLPAPPVPATPGVRMTVLRGAGEPLGDFRLSAGRPIAGGAPRAGILRRDLRVAPRWTLTEGLASVWAVGLLLIVLRYALATLGVRRWTRGAHPLGGARWADALAHARATLGRVPTPRLVELPAADVPLVWGVRRPVVFLPLAARAWTDERRALVLTHELAHVRRGDVLLEGLVQLCCALYWFHPLAWIAARRLRLERERACDDLVVGGGVRPSTYAAHLLAIAEGMTPRNPPPIVALCAARLDDSTRAWRRS